MAAPIAVTATLASVGLGVFAHQAAPVVAASRSSDAIGTTALDLHRLDLHREDQVSRSMDRRELRLLRSQELAYTKRLQAEQAAETRAVVRKAKHDRVKLWTTAPLNIWSSPDADAKQVGEVEEGKQVLVTGRQENGRVELVLKGVSRWVSAGYLTDEKPVAAAAGLSMAPCPDSSVEHGLTQNAVYVYRSVCHAFPQITTYGGWDNHGEHASGRALDIMTSDVELGTAIAEYLQAHAAELHLYDILWRQHIWTPVRSAEGWRSMPSRGSATANHYDHVHVSTY